MSKAKKAIRQVADGFSSGEQDRTAVRVISGYESYALTI